MKSESFGLVFRAHFCIFTNFCNLVFALNAGSFEGGLRENDTIVHEAAHDEVGVSQEEPEVSWALGRH